MDIIHSRCFSTLKCVQKNTSEKERIAFRKDLKEFVDTELVQQYKTQVTEEQHEQNIEKLCSYSREKHEVLFEKGSLNIGVSQKLLNLYLKYQWCNGWIATPPHFPVDRIIQQKLKVQPLQPWTQFEDINDYKTVIEYAKKYASEHKHNSLAEMELHLFNRR